MELARPNKPVLIVYPFLLIASTAIVFYFGTRYLGQFAGYLIGFGFYWLFWCLLIPLLLLKKNFPTVFRNKKPLFTLKNWWILLLLASTIIAPVFMYFIPGLPVTPLFVVLAGIAFGFVHAFFEELFWRGVYISFFPDDWVMGVVFPTVMFSLWHFAPQIAIPDPNMPVFVASTLPLGIVYALTARASGSALWSAIAHGISGALAFGGFLATSLYALING
ncbi:MAG: hypothetical protein A2Y33_07915 [Spirochaetes bacterium GWF1_51_8]|nr:MAG: hypothetical protein A2Y33_07915 [Spirochaetes bacterium GWF1_51_8]